MAEEPQTVDETLWALVQRRRGKRPCLCYLMSTSAQEVWRIVINEDWLGTGHTRATLRKAGWRAERVRVTEAAQTKRRAWLQGERHGA